MVSNSRAFIRKRLCAAIVLVLSWVTVSTAGAVDTAADDASGAQVVTRETLESKLSEIEAASELNQDTRDLLSELYLKSISNLEANDSQRKATAGYARSIVEDPAAAEELNEQTKRLRYRPYHPQLGVARDAETTKIAQELLELRSRLGAAAADVTRMQLAIEDEQRRLAEARQELSDASSSQSVLPQSLDNIDQGDESQAIKQARVWYRQTSFLALNSQIKMLDQELLSHTPRLQLLDAQIARGEVTVEHLRQDIAAIEAILGERRQAEADEAIALAQKVQLESEGKDPLLIGVATENAWISTRLLTLANAIEEENTTALEVDEQAKLLEENFRRVRQKLDVAGMNRALGRILQEQRSALPNSRVIKSELKNKEALISDITLEQLVIDERRKELRRPQRFADDMLDEARDGWVVKLDRTLSMVKVPGTRFSERPGGDGGAGPEQGTSTAPDEALAVAMSDEEVLGELTALLQDRADLLGKLAVANSSYLQALSELEFAQRRLVNVVNDYEAFLSQRLLWVRSVAYPTVDNLLTFSGEVLTHFDGPEWRRVGRQVLVLNAFTPLLLVGLLVAGLLLYQRRQLRRRLFQTNRFLGNPVKDHFSYTLEALGLSILLCVPGPLILLSLCAKLVGTPDQSALHQALIPGLFWLSLNWFVFLVFYQICCPEGLAHRHFRWHVPALRPLRQEVFLLMALYLPVGFLSVVSTELDASAMEWPGVRWLLALSMLTFAGFFLRVLRREGRVMKTLYHSKAGVLLVRLRWLWLALSVLIPVVLVGLTAVGYVYTAMLLMSSFVMSFWVLILLVLTHQLCVRWLTMTASQLQYKVLQEEQKKQLEEAIDSGGKSSETRASLVDDPLLNLALLGRDSLKLVNILTGIVAVFGFLLVWSELLPALGYLNNIQLWDSLSTVDGDTVLQPITLADFGLSVLIISITIFLYRTLPSLLELFLSQVFKMPNGTRYTVITLTRYTLLIISVFYVASLLGFEWAKIQWLVAALGVGIGFGLQEIVANFISGLIILFERPIRVGDRVTVGDIEGNVSRIRARATTIQTWDRQELLVPNKEFITGPLLNWSLSDRISRLVVNVGIAYGSDVARALAIVQGVADAEDKVLADPVPFVTLESFGDNSLNLCLRCFLDDMEARLETNSRLNEAINSAFEQAGIVISFPQVDVHFDEKQPLNVRLDKGLMPQQ